MKPAQYLKEKIIPLAKTLWAHPAAKPVLAGFVLGLLTHMTYEMLRIEFSAPKYIIKPQQPGPPQVIPGAGSPTPPPAAVIPAAPVVTPSLSAAELWVLLQNVPPPLKDSAREYIELIQRLKEEHEKLPPEQRASHREKALRLISDTKEKMHLTIEQYPEIQKFELESKATLEH